MLSICFYLNKSFDNIAALLLQFLLLLLLLLLFFTKLCHIFPAEVSLYYSCRDKLVNKHFLPSGYEFGFVRGCGAGVYFQKYNWKSLNTFFFLLLSPLFLLDLKSENILIMKYLFKSKKRQKRKRKS